MTKKEKLTKLVDQEELDTVEHLRAQLREKDALIRRYQDSRGGLVELGRNIMAATKAVKPYAKVPFRFEASSSEITAVANLSDWHVGEVIRLAETGGFGSFDFQTAEKRAFRYADNVIAWTLLNRKSYNLQDLEVLALGDYVSGDIHGELLVTNEFPLPVQMVKAGNLMAGFIARLAPHFRSVKIRCVGADNHGRLTRKPQAKQKAANNASYVVHAIVEKSMELHPNVKVVQYEDMAPLVDIAGHGFILTHGDIVRSWQGVPWYGLERYMAKEAVRRMGHKEFSFINCGHYHTPVFLNRLLMNGALTGTSEYDHACGRYGPPCQISYLVHSRHGIFNFVPWKFSVEGAA